MRWRASSSNDDGSEWTVGDIADAGLIGGLGPNYRVGVTAV